jgi:hypothetical protein
MYKARQGKANVIRITCNQHIIIGNLGFIACLFTYPQGGLPAGIKFTSHHADAATSFQWLSAAAFLHGFCPFSPEMSTLQQ